MSNITSYQDLLIEKQRLTLLLYERKIQLTTEFEQIKTKLRPLAGILDFAEKITTKDRNNPLINMGIEVGVNLLLKKVLLRNAGWIIKIIMPFVVKNFLSHEAAENPTWIQKMVHMIKKKIR